MRYQAALVAVFLALGSSGLSAQEEVTITRPGREVSLPASEVKDTFFAYIMGIISSGVEAEIDNEEMRAILVEFKTTLNLPFDLISRVGQHTDPDTAVRRIGLEFQRDVAIPIPFSILFYHPGRISATQVLSFDVHQSTWTDSDSASETSQVFDLSLTVGSILVEIDGWLKALFGDHLEDTWIQHIVFFRFQGDWIGMMEGTGRPSGKVRRAYFDLTKNSMIFPVPEPLHRAGQGLIPDTPPSP